MSYPSMNCRIIPANWRGQSSRPREGAAADRLRPRVFPPAANSRNPTGRCPAVTPPADRGSRFGPLVPSPGSVPKELKEANGIRRPFRDPVANITARKPSRASVISAVHGGFFIARFPRLPVFSARRPSCGRQSGTENRPLFVRIPTLQSSS